MASMERDSTKNVLDQLADGSAWFEYVGVEDLDLSGAPFASISAAFSNPRRKSTSFFARVRPLAGDRRQGDARAGPSPALKKVEYHTVRPMIGDGRCMFRALVVGMAINKGQHLTHYEEEQEADQLRLAVMDAMCRPEQQRSHKFDEALIAITVEESLKRYCQRIASPSFWGGESELLVLSRMCHQPVIVYIPEAEAKQSTRWGGGFIPIAEYGSEFRQASKERKARKPVRLLYSGRNHYDLLL